MDFSSLFSDLQSVWLGLLVQLRLFIQKIGQYPLVIFALMVVIAVPSMYLVFDFLINAVGSSEDVTDNALGWFRLFQKRRQKIEAKELRESFKRDKQWEYDFKKNNAYIKAQEFFKNNPKRMSINIDGFKFFQKDFEKKNWRYQNYTSYSSDITSRTVEPKSRDKRLDISVDDNS